MGLEIGRPKYNKEYSLSVGDIHTNNQVARILNNIDRWFPNFFERWYSKFTNICHNYVAYKYLEARSQVKILVPNHYTDGCDFGGITSFGEIFELYIWISFLSLIEKNKKYFIYSITDDSFPLSIDALGDEELKIGRIENAKLLGVLNIYEAIPALLEAGLHDNNRQMRSTCFNALHNMERGIEKYLYNIAPSLSRYLLGNKDSYDKIKILELLSSIGNPEIVPILRNIIEDLVYHIEFQEKLLGHDINFSSFLPSDIIKNEELSKSVDMFIATMDTILKLDPKTAKELGATFKSATVRTLYKRELIWKETFSGTIHIPDNNEVEKYGSISKSSFSLK